ncbi:MAG: RNA polymerase sigma factor [Deltaproteobacteria bacterium]|nr:RNA polymerase sigma factor [Deltaproteobacteria bacterium]
MTRDEEIRCIDRCLDGHAESYRPLVETYHARLIHLLLKMTGRPDVAEEIAQQAFLKAYQKLASFRRESSFFTWLTRIAFRLSYDSFRQENRFVDVTIEDLPLSNDQDGAVPGENEEMAQAVQASVAELKPRYREVIALRFIDEMPVREIAETLRVGESAVKMRIHRGLEMLKEILQRKKIYEP